MHCSWKEETGELIYHAYVNRVTPKKKIVTPNGKMGGSDHGQDIIAQVRGKTGILNAKFSFF